MPRVELDYLMFDADNHYYESADAFTRYLDPAFRHRMHWVTNERGHRKIVIDDVVYQYVLNPTFDPVSVAGADVEMYRNAKTREQLKDDALAGHKVVEPLANHPEYRDKDERIKVLDAQGIEGTILFPTLSSGIEQAMAHAPDLTYAVLNAFNRWMQDDWPHGYQGRLWSMPQVSLIDVQQGIAQLETAIANGARAVMLRAAPVRAADGWFSPGDPRFDPFWARVQEANVAVVIHAADSGYTEASARWQSATDPVGVGSLRASVFGQMIDYPRAIADMVMALIVHGVFTRFPGVRVMSVENGAEWLPPLVRTLKKNWWHNPAKFTANPVEQFRQNIWISPFWEEDLQEIAEYVTVDRICAGSDWPHPEGLGDPTEYVLDLKTFSPEEQRKIMRTNALTLLGLPVT